MAAYRTAPLEAILQGAKTGDIVLFSGKGCFSNLVRHCSNVRDWSHVGVVIRFTEASDVPENFARLRMLVQSRAPCPLVCLFESTYENEMVTDLVNGVHKDGPQITLLAETLQSYEGHSIGIRRLATLAPDRPGAQREFTRRIAAFAQENYAAEYDLNPRHWLGTGFRMRYWATGQDPPAYYCTALVADALISAGVMQPQMKGRDFNLSDFDMTARLPLLPGFQYQETTFLTGL